MVLDISRALNGPRILVSFKFGEDLGIALTRKIRQDIEAPTVGHRNRNLVDAATCRLAQDLIEKRNQGLAAFKRESLLPQIFGLQELFESLSVNQCRQNAALLLGRRSFERSFNAFLHPVALLRILDMHVFDTNRSNVGIVQA